MTLGITSIAPTHENDKVWKVDEYASAPLTDTGARYYLYAVVPRVIEGGIDEERNRGRFLLSETAIEMEAEAENYHLLAGVLNKEMQDGRSFVPLYGFTEILPGRITTDKIVSANGGTYFDLANNEIGGVIKFLTDTNDYMTLIEGGKIRSQFLDVHDVTAKRLVVGDENGKHVLIEPNEVTGEGTLKMFDGNGSECVAIEGNEYTSVTDFFSTKQAGNFPHRYRTKHEDGGETGENYGKGSFSAFTNSYTIRITKPVYSEAMTEVSVSGAVIATAESYAWRSDQSPIKINRTSEVEFSLAVDTYADEELTAFADSSVLLYNKVKADANMTHTEKKAGGVEFHDGETQTTESVKFIDTKARVGSGYHVVVLRVNTKGSNTQSVTKQTFAWGTKAGEGCDDITASYSNDFYQTRIFANGIVMGSGLDNHLAVIRNGNRMNMVARSGNIGLMVSGNAIKTQWKGESWISMPMLIFNGDYEFKNSKYVAKSGFLSFDGNAPEANKAEKGAVKLQYPQNWYDKLGDIGTSRLIVNVNGNSTTIDARVLVMDYTGISICLSDDDSLNDASFHITIYYIA